MTPQIQQIKDELKGVDTLAVRDAILFLCDAVEALQKTVAEQEAKIEQLQRKGPWKF